MTILNIVDLNPVKLYLFDNLKSFLNTYIYINNNEPTFFTAMRADAVRWPDYDVTDSWRAISSKSPPPHSANHAVRGVMATVAKETVWWLDGDWICVYTAKGLFLVRLSSFLTL